MSPDSIASLIEAAGRVLDDQAVEDQGRWLITPPGLVPELRHLLLVHRNRAMAAARRKRRRHQRCGARR